ncbi:MAG: DUF1540 domain-containing protein [Halothermotrichaceae bacterium]
MAKIKCNVDNCYYWDTGNICGADEIEVAKNFFDNSDMEAGAMGANPSDSNQTKCKTFKPAKNKKGK